MGRVLKVVLDADPPTLDPHASTTTLVFVVRYHMFAGLYSLDESLKPISMLGWLLIYQFGRRDTFPTFDAQKSSLSPF